MNTIRIPKGSVVFIGGGRFGKSPYLVISTYRNSNCDFIQCMPIIQMEGINEFEIPIVISRDISYVVPYVIKSFKFRDIDFNDVAGYLEDNSFFTTQQFLDLLYQVYGYLNGFQRENFVNLELDSKIALYTEYIKAKYPSPVSIQHVEPFNPVIPKDIDLNIIEDNKPNDSKKEIVEKNKYPAYSPKRGLPNWDDDKLIQFVTMYSGSEEDKAFVMEYYNYSKTTAQNYFSKAKTELRHRNLKV